MLFIGDATIDRYLNEDVPYIDLTTLALGIGHLPGRIRFASRESAVLAGVEEVLRLFKRLDICPVRHRLSGEWIGPGEVFLEADGQAANLHAAWKVSANILEHCSGIATRTRRLVDKAKGVAPRISIVTTRKSFPGTKELAVKSAIAGGAYPHRLGLSETILIFQQHKVFLEQPESLPSRIAGIKVAACEKKVLVEVETVEEALELAGAGVDGLQFDKMKAHAVRAAVERVRRIAPGITLIAAGGINEGNIEEYAGTGVDAIATTSVFFGAPIDMRVTMEKRA
jgi:molybdenum transport protein